MLKKSALFIACCLVALISPWARAQTTQIVANHIAYFGGTTVTGTFCLTPTNQAGQPINIVTSLGQQVSPQVPLCFPITSGVLSSSAIVPDTSTTQPVNACYSAVVNNYYGQQVGVFPCIQPSGATWSFDSYVPSSTPSIPALSLPQYQVNGTPLPNQAVVNFVGGGVSLSGQNIALSTSLPSIANNTILGNDSGSSGVAAALTASQVATILSGSFDASGAASAAQAASLPRSFFTVGSGGVTANQIVSFDSSGHAIAASGTGFGGLAAATVSAGGTVEVIRNGTGTCVFDAAAVVGDIAIPSTTTPGECHDSGLTSTQSILSTTSIVGAIESAAASAGTTGAIRLHGPGSVGATAGNLVSTSASSALMNSNYWVDGFVPALYPGINVAPISWTSGTYPLCQVVSYSGQNYVAVGAAGATAGVTPGTNSAVWYAVPGGDFRVGPAQCAFYMAEAAMGSSLQASATLIFGSNNTSYPIYGPLVVSPTGGQVNLVGISRGDQGSSISLKAMESMTTMYVSDDRSSSVSTPYDLLLAQMTFDGNRLAQHGFDLGASKAGVVSHVDIKNMVGTDYWVRFGDNSPPGGDTGYGYQWHVSDVQLASAGTGFSSWATGTISQSGGVPSYSITTGGTYNYATEVGHLWGTGAGNGQPCTTMGTIAVTMSGTGPYSVSGVAFSGFSGCAGTMYFLIPDQPAAAVGIAVDNLTDSTFVHLVDNAVGTTRCIEALHGENTFIHVHAYGCPVAIHDEANSTWFGTEFDNSIIEGADIFSNYSQFHASQFINSVSYGVLQTGFYMGTQTTLQSFGNTCYGNTPAAFNLVNTATGPVGHGLNALYPSKSTILGIQCDDLSAAAYIPGLTQTTSYSTNVVGSSLLTGQAASLGNTTLYTATAAGFYQVSGNATVTTLGTTGTIQIGFNYNNGAAQTINGGSTSVTTLGAISTITTSTIYLAAGQSVFYHVTLTSGTGAVYSTTATVYALNGSYANPYNLVPLTTVASASTIAPTTATFTLTGTTSVSTITPFSGASSTIGGCLDFFTPSAVPFVTGGNLATTALITTTPGQEYHACYDGTSWYIK